MGEGKRKKQAMGGPADGWLPMAYAKADPYWLAGRHPSLSFASETLLMRLIMTTALASAYNPDANPLEPIKPKVDVTFQADETPPITLIDGNGRIHASDETINGFGIQDAFETLGLKKAVIDFHSGYIGLAPEEIVWVQKGTSLLMRSDGELIEDPVAFCEGRLRRAPGSEHYFRADVPLTCQISLLENEEMARHMPKANMAHILGFMQSCQKFPSTRSRAIGAYADQQAAMAMLTGQIEPTEFGPLIDMREIVMDVFERRPDLKVYDEILAGTTMPDGQAVTRAFDQRTRGGDWESNQIFADALLRAAGRESIPIPETAGMISLEHGSPTAARDMSLVSVQSFLASMTPVSTVDDAQVIAALYALEEGFAMALMGSDLTNLVFWDDAKAAAEIKSRAAAVPEKRSGH